MSSSKLKILTFNWHEPYITLLAKTKFSFDVVLPSLGRSGTRMWDEKVREVPTNVKVVSLHEANENLESEKYDLAVCHNFLDVKEVSNYDVPVVLIFHNKLSCDLALGGNTVLRETYLSGAHELLERVNVKVFVSKSKRNDWGFVDDGEVIVPGIDLDEFYKYEGNVEKVLRVGNLMKERDLMLGHTLQESICERFSSTTLGYNPSLTGVEPSESWEKLKENYKSHRLYLNTTLHPNEDGYNLAMLEAMASGTPVVSASNPTSPIESGVSGFLFSDIDEGKNHISALLKDRYLAEKIGTNGKGRVAELFPIKRFIDSWTGVLQVFIKR